MYLRVLCGDLFFLCAPRLNKLLNCFLHHALKRDMLLGCDATTILVLWRIVRDGAVPTRNLDSHITPLSRYIDEAAMQNSTILLTMADAQTAAAADSANAAPDTNAAQTAPAAPPDAGAQPPAGSPPPEPQFDPVLASLIMNRAVALSLANDWIKPAETRRAGARAGRSRLHHGGWFESCRLLPEAGWATPWTRPGQPDPLHGSRRHLKSLRGRHLATA